MPHSRVVIETGGNIQYKIKYTATDAGFNNRKESVYDQNETFQPEHGTVIIKGNYANINKMLNIFLYTHSMWYQYLEWSYEVYM